MKPVCVGSDPGCEIVLAGSGVAKLHLKISWSQGFVVEDLGTGKTRHNNVVIQPGTTFVVQSFQDQITCGSTPLSLGHPALRVLYLRTSNNASPGPPFFIGSDDSVCHLVVDHPSVHPCHLRILHDAKGEPMFEDCSDGGGLFSSTGAALTRDTRYRVKEFPGVYLSRSVWLPFDVVPGLAHDNQKQSITKRLQKKGPGTIVVEPQRLSKGNPIVIGRRPDCDVCLAFPQISARHCRLDLDERDGLRITDLGSRNGTLVGGRPLLPNEPTKLVPGERFFVGPFPLRLSVSNGRALALDPAGEYGLDLVEVDISAASYHLPPHRNNKKGERLLDNVSFKALPGNCIAVMGPSGAGKTTLLNIIAGTYEPTEGTIRINGENLATLFDAVRGYIGYVPQDDILHPELKVEEAIRYSAKLRLPPDFTDHEIEQRIEATLRDLRLSEKRGALIGRPENKVLSGGERKRVNIALELVTEPRLLLLDEPTSGLAADDAASFVEMMTDLARRTRMTVLMTIHQPAKEDFEHFSHTLVLVFGGKVAYFGTPTRSYGYFGDYLRAHGHEQGTPGPRDIFRAISLREQKAESCGNLPSVARRVAANEWQEAFQSASAPAPNNTSEMPLLTRPSAANVPRARSVSRSLQLGQLLHRYARVKLRDTSGLLVLLLQAPIIGLLITLVFLNRPIAASDRKAGAIGEDSLPCLHLMETLERPLVKEFDTKAESASQKDLAFWNLSRKFEQRAKNLGARFDAKVSDQARALFLLVIAAIWFGTSNAAREVVAEQAIYMRERRVNLGILNYVLSKFLVLGAVCVVQCLILSLIAAFGLSLAIPFVLLCGILLLASLCSVAIGLLLSTIVRSTEAAVALTPLTLIPQVVLGGGVVELTRSAWMPYAAAAMPSRWAYELAIYAERSHVSKSWPKTPLLVETSSSTGEKDFSFHENFSCAKEHVLSMDRGGMGFPTAGQPYVATTILGIVLLLSLGIVAALLKRRDKR